MNTNVKVIFNRSKKLDNNNEALVQIRTYTGNGRYRFISTGISISKSDWDPKKTCVRKTHPFHDVYNQKIANTLAQIMLGNDFTVKNNTAQSFNNYFTEKLDKEKIIKEVSRRNHHMTLNHLNKFNRHINISEINQALMNNFQQYLHAAGLANNTVVRHLKCVKRYINLLADDEFITREKASNTKVKPKWESTKFVFLTMNEVEAIAKLEPTTESVRKTQNAFLLSCYTGLRHSDIMRLKMSDFYEKEEGLYIFLGEMRKVKKQLFLPLYKFFDGRGEKLAKQLLDDSEDLMFPKFNSVKANVNIKVLAHAAGIKKHLTYHTSRHTFGTLLATETKNMFDVMTYMGHGSSETSLNYIHYSQLL